MNGTAKFIKFQTGALLRSDELNTSFDYAKAKDKLSNRLLDGAGIVQGLNVTWANNALTISEGAGVTSDGQLLFFESRTFNTSQGVADAIIKSLPSFSGVSELTQGDGKTNPLTLDFLKDKCIFLYPTATTSNLADCSLRTDQKNQICTDDVKVLIGTPTTKNNADENACLYTPCLLRLGDTGKEAIDFSSFTSTSVLETEYKKIIDKNIDEIVKAYTSVGTCYQDLFCGVPFSGLSEMLTKQLGLFSKTTILYPYFNDYLKTLAAAYEEFANTEGVYKKLKIVKSDAFPNYLSLGNGINCDCRQYWQPSPANSAAYKEAMFYARRMVALVNSSNLRFDEIIKGVITPNPTDSNQEIVPTPIYITPSHAASMPLSERAIPFYFKSTEVKKYWNFKLSNLILTQDIPSYNDEKNKILCENIKGYDFYRIENAIGQRAKIAIEYLIGQKKDLNLAFDVKAVVIGDNLPLSIYFEDLQRQYYNLRLQIVCAIQSYIDNDNRIKLPKQPIELPFLLSTFCNNSKLLDNLQKLKQVTTILCFIPLLEDLCEAYNSRLKDYLFPQFAKKQTGLDYCGGVPKGGTWVMLINAAPREEAKVVAHFALPAQCCVEDSLIKCFLDKEITPNDITTITVEPSEGQVDTIFNFKSTFTLSNTYDFVEWSIDNIPEQTKRHTSGVTTYSKAAKNIISGQHTVTLRVANCCSETEQSARFTVLGKAQSAGIAQRFEAVETGLDKAEGKIKTVESGLDTVESKIKAVETGLDTAKGKIKTVETGLDTAEGKIKTVETGLDTAEGKIKTVETGLGTAEGKIKAVEIGLDKIKTVENRLKVLEDKESLASKVKIIPNSDIDPSTVFKSKGRELSIQESEMTESTASEGIDKQLRQRHDSYRKLIDEIEKDEAINDNKAFNLTKVFVFFPKPKAAFTANFEETIQALFASINRSKKEEQQQKLTALLQTATHFYLDKIIATGEPIDTATKALADVKDFMIKKGMNTSEFIANWKSAAIKTDENKAMIEVIQKLFS